MNDTSRYSFFNHPAFLYKNRSFSAHFFKICCYYCYTIRNKLIKKGIVIGNNSDIFSNIQFPFFTLRQNYSQIMLAQSKIGIASFYVQII